MQCALLQEVPRSLACPQPSGTGRLTLYRQLLRRSGISATVLVLGVIRAGRPWGARASAQSVWAHCCYSSGIRPAGRALSAALLRLMHWWFWT